MADKRTQALSQKTTKDYDDNAITDQTGNAEALRMSMDTLLRKATANTINGATGTVNADFTNYDQIIINAVGNVTVNVQNVTDGDTRSQLLITRTDPLTQTISFTGISGTIDGPIQGVGTLYYNVYKASGSTFMRQMNTQFGGNLLLSNLGAGVNVTTINTLFYFEIQKNLNITHFEALFIFTPASTTGFFHIAITGWVAANKNPNIPVSVEFAGGVASGKLNLNAAGTGSIQIHSPTLVGIHPREVLIQGSFLTK